MSASRIVVALVAAALLLLGAGEASAATVAEPVSATQIREYGATIVFSGYDPVAKTWSLYTRPSGAQPGRVPVPPSPTPFDADIGTDTLGRPALIYERCLRFAEVRLDTFITQTATDCDLYVYSLALGGSERPVRNANDPASDDTNPTIWRGRIAWARRYGSNVVVYTKRLTTPRSAPSTRLPGVPEQRCIENPRRCATTKDRTVRTLEMREDRLVLTVGYTCHGCGGIAEAQLRLDDIRRGTSRSIWRISSGLAGQTISGPSLMAHSVGWYFGCGVREPSCKSVAGPHRYDLSTKRYTRAAGPIDVNGFTDAGTRLYEALGCPSPLEVQLSGGLASACRIEELPAPTFTAIKPRL